MYISGTVWDESTNKFRYWYVHRKTYVFSFSGHWKRNTYFLLSFCARCLRKQKPQMRTRCCKTSWLNTFGRIHIHSRNLLLMSNRKQSQSDMETRRERNIYKYMQYIFACNRPTFLCSCTVYIIRPELFSLPVGRYILISVVRPKVIFVKTDQRVCVFCHRLCDSVILTNKLLPSDRWYVSGIRVD